MREYTENTIMATALVILLALPWMVCTYRFMSCDFEEPYLCEVTNGIGVFLPPTAIFVVWIDTDRYSE